MKEESIFIIIILIGVLVIVGTGLVRASVQQTTTEMNCQEKMNAQCSNKGIIFEKPFEVESAHITWIENCK